VGLFLASVGAPCFALAANTPLLQAWLARGGRGNAHLLYCASNLGSFIGLLAYPSLTEPLFGLSMRGRLWGLGFAVLAFGLVASGHLTLRANRATTHREPTRRFAYQLEQSPDLAGAGPITARRPLNCKHRYPVPEETT
jgi:hypothetical protein